MGTKYLMIMSNYCRCQKITFNFFMWYMHNIKFPNNGSDVILRQKRMFSEDDRELTRSYITARKQAVST